MRKVCSSAGAVAQHQQALLPASGTARAARGRLWQHNFTRLLEGNNFSELKGLLVVLPFLTSVVTGVVWLAGGVKEGCKSGRKRCWLPFRYTDTIAHTEIGALQLPL